MIPHFFMLLLLGKDGLIDFLYHNQIFLWKFFFRVEARPDFVFFDFFSDWGFSSCWESLKGLKFCKLELLCCLLWNFLLQVALVNTPTRRTLSTRPPIFRLWIFDFLKPRISIPLQKFAQLFHVYLLSILQGGHLIFNLHFHLLCPRLFLFFNDLFHIFYLTILLEISVKLLRILSTFLEVGEGLEDRVGVCRGWLSYSYVFILLGVSIVLKLSYLTKLGVLELGDYLRHRIWFGNGASLRCTLVHGLDNFHLLSHF